MLKISMNRLDELYAALSSLSALYLPLEHGSQVLFERWSADAKVRLDALNAAKSPKELFFPQSENLMAFKREGKKIEILESRDDNEIFTVFGVRACDAAALAVLDRVFLSEPADGYYQNRRNNGTVITLACCAPEETCFCTAFGIDPLHPGCDISTHIAGDTLYWNILTPKGHALTEKVAALFEEADASDEEALAVSEEKTAAILRQLPYGRLDLTGWDGEHTLEKFNSPLWESLSQSCLGCGTCTFVCPTCQCYDIRDYDTGHGVKRYRCWDSCMYSEFTKMAGGNPRLTQKERFRQRFMHKLVYFPANNEGVYGCVGCGRCLAKCPVSMNIVKVVKAIGGTHHEE